MSNIVRIEPLHIIDFIEEEILDLNMLVEGKVYGINQYLENNIYPPTTTFEIERFVKTKIHSDPSERDLIYEFQPYMVYTRTGWFYVSDELRTVEKKRTEVIKRHNKDTYKLVDNADINGLDISYRVFDINPKYFNKTPPHPLMILKIPTHSLFNSDVHPYYGKRVRETDQLIEFLNIASSLGNAIAGINSEVVEDAKADINT
jgi:hypothetical protein